MRDMKARGIAFLLTAASVLGSTMFMFAQSSKRAAFTVLPAGTRLLVRMVDSVDSSKQKAGYRFKATLEANLQAYDVTVAPKGTTLYGVLAAASSTGKFKGSSQLTL